MQSIQGKVPSDRYIYLVDNRQDSRLIRIADNKLVFDYSRQFKWRKTPIPLRDIVSHPFYTLLEVGNQKLKEVEWTFEEEEPLAQAEEDEDVKNNKDIFLISEPQKMQIDEIQRKKKEMRPEELIGELVQNNQQFKKRSEYSKQKYLKKKQQKYMFQFHAEPISLANVHKHYFHNQKDHIYSIRWDMFALMMLYSGPYKRVLIAGQDRGLLLGGVMSKKWEKITVVSGKSNASTKNYPIVDQLNIDGKTQEKIEFIDWSTLKVQSQEKTGETQSSRFDNCILMGNYAFPELCSLLHPLLSQSAIVTYFCHSLSILEQAARLMRAKGYLNVRIFDSWCRQYQVLKNRTHPMMNMDSCSGYLLTAIAVK